MAKKEKIKPKTVWYYNNNPVIIIRRETEDFFLVQGMKNVNTDISGSEFCQACQIGGTSSHSCDDAQLVIETMIEEAERGEIFWVKEESLKEKPIEFLVWEKLKSDNEKLAKQLEPRKNDLAKIKNIEYRLKNLTEDKDKYSKEVSELKKQLKEIKKESKSLNKEVELCKLELKELLKKIKEEQAHLEKYIPKKQKDRCLELD